MSDRHDIENHLRIAVGQFNPTVGDVAGNLAKAREAGEMLGAPMAQSMAASA